MADVSHEDEILENVYHLNAGKVKDTKKNAKLTSLLVEIADESNLKSCEKAHGALLYTLGTKYAKKAFPHRKEVIRYILEGKLAAGVRIEKALSFVLALGSDSPFVAADFEKSCGVGVVVSEKEIEDVVDAVFDADSTLLEMRYRAEGRLRKEVNASPALVFAEKKTVNAVFEKKIFARLGEKTDADKGKKKTEKKPPKKETKKEEEVYETLPENVEYPPPEANTQNRVELLRENLDFLNRNNAGVITRFPPEPNGYLHVGHAKSMNLNFGYARRKGGVCYLRFDDTNPASEKQEYIDNIIENVKWLGHTPWMVTYSSDYFDELYKLGEKLIEVGSGYICECEDKILREKRKAGEDCEHRGRSVEENMRLFREMRDGKHKQGSMIMRMKGNMQSPNTTMRDMVAYRIITDKEHPRTGDKWKIYPSYDFTHCICDSLENITHSLCSLEFCVRRPAYEWLLERLDLYCPPQREFSRMEIRGAVLSKRRLLKLVDNKIVNGWDDPRLFTLNGLRRRGYTPEAINVFCKNLSVTRSDGASVDMSVLEGCCRKIMDRDCDRMMVVLDPLRVVITNYPEDKVERVTVPNHPQHPDLGTHEVLVSRVVFIEGSDFRLEDSKTYKRLAPEKWVRLRYGPNIKCTGVKKDESGKVIELEAEYDVDGKGVSDEERKSLGTIHWVASPSPDALPKVIEVRNYGRLFKSDNPSALPSEEFLENVAPDSLEIIPNAYVDVNVDALAPGVGVQFERLGFYTVDPDTTHEKMVFNRTVPLKDSYKK